jgi:hypothetical protein
MTASSPLRNLALSVFGGAMRRLFLLAIMQLFLWTNASEAAPCKAGETVTLEGEIIIPPVVDGGEWFWPGKFAQTPCQVTTLKGKGALPAECKVGKRMTLTGRVLEEGILTLDVTNIRCY